MRYTTSLDKPTKISTAALTALFVGIAALEFATFSEEARIGAWVSTTIFILVYGAAYIYRPMGYTLTDSELIIHRPISDVTYTLATFKSIEVIPRENLKFTIRTFGVGGLWGYFGQFYNGAYGSMTWYVTRRDQLVLIKTNQKKSILLSPDNIDSFTNALENCPLTVG